MDSIILPYLANPHEIRSHRVSMIGLLQCRVQQQT